MSKTSTHLAIQQFIQDQLGKEHLCLEKNVVPGRVADCVWKEEKIVFEVQVSPLSREEVLQRSAAYQSRGYSVVWILSDKTFGNGPATSAEKALTSIPHYYTNIDEKNDGAIYDRLLSHHFSRQYILQTSTVDISHPQRLANNRKIPTRTLWDINFSGDYTLQKEKKSIYAHFCKRVAKYHQLLLEKWVG